MHTVDTFSGTFAITEHSKIAEVLVEYLVEKLQDKIDNNRPLTKRHILADIDLETINRELNEVWEGPGSVKKIKDLTFQYRSARMDNYIVKSTKNTKDNTVPTIDSNLQIQD